MQYSNEICIQLCCALFSRVGYPFITHVLCIRPHFFSLNFLKISHKLSTLYSFTTIKLVGVLKIDLDRIFPRKRFSLDIHKICFAHDKLHPTPVFAQHKLGPIKYIHNGQRSVSTYLALAVPLYSLYSSISDRRISLGTIYTLTLPQAQYLL